MISNVHIDVLNPYLGFVQTKLQGIICSVRYASYPKIFFTFLDPPSQCRHHVTRQRATCDAGARRPDFCRVRSLCA